MNIVKNLCLKETAHEQEKLLSGKRNGAGYLRIYELRGGIFLIVGKEKALLFDTGYGADLKEAVEIITRLPLYVVNSGHGSQLR